MRNPFRRKRWVIVVVGEYSGHRTRLPFKYRYLKDAKEFVNTVTKKQPRTWITPNPDTSIPHQPYQIERITVK